jgi:alcohol dehydrogenase
MMSCGKAVCHLAAASPATSSALQVLRPGGTLSSLGVYSGKLSVPMELFPGGLGDYKIVTTLCPGGKEGMRRLMELVRRGRLDLTPFLTHTFSLDRITETHQLFGKRRDGVIKVAIKPSKKTKKRAKRSHRRFLSR